MSRSVRDANLETRAARARLAPRGDAYFRALDPGLHLGYRKPKKGPGKWVARYYVGERLYQREVLAIADDSTDADGVAVLSYRQAQEMARARMASRAHAAAGKTGPMTVADAVDAYLDYLDAQKRSGLDARHRANAFILPDLGKLEVEQLTAKKIDEWHKALAKAPARIRSSAKKAQRYKAEPTDDEAKRRRKATANRTLTVLKAALNRQWRAGKVASDAAWRRVEPFEDVDAARVRYLSIAEAQRLINAAEPAFRALVKGALETGCRYGELCALEVHDFNPDSGTVAIRRSKSGSARHVVLTDDGAAFFARHVAGRDGRERMFRRADSEPWKPSQQARPTADACTNGKVTPPITFHGLRHTWASHAVMNGVPLLVVAKNLGHADTRMVEKHYGHLAPSYVADAIRKGAPRFGSVADNVEPMEARR